MHIKRYEAETMQAALAEVREELGPDAVILNTRTLRRDRGVFGLLAKPRVEVTAATDVPSKAAPTPAARRNRRVAADDSWRTLQVSRAMIAPLEDELREIRAALEASRAERPEEPSLAVEIAELRRLARAMAAQVGEPASGSTSARYRAAGLSSGLSHELAAAADLRVAEGAERDAAVVDVLAERLAPRLAPPRSDAGHQLVVGASGVGKTTSVAKQVGWFPDPHARVVSTDAHRLGGSEGLRGIADCLGVRFDLVASQEALSRLAGKADGRVIVDTPGAGREDAERYGELAAFRRALGDQAGVQLVLSATTKESDLRRELSRYAFLEPSALVVTKVDESLDLGNVVNVLLEETTPPLAWIANGQNVPEDFDVPSPEALAQRVMQVSP